MGIDFEKSGTFLYNVGFYLKPAVFGTVGPSTLEEQMFGTFVFQEEWKSPEKIYSDYK